jgi:hypothetical protein
MYAMLRFQDLFRRRFRPRASLIVMAVLRQQRFAQPWRVQFVRVEIEVMVGFGNSTLRTIGAVCPTLALLTFTVTLTPFATSAFGMLAVTCELLTKVEGRCASFQRTTESERKLLPFTVSVKSLLPGATEEGVRLTICGALDDCDDPPPLALLEPPPPPQEARSRANAVATLIWPDLNLSPIPRR